MRTFKITLWASVAGWLAGIVAGNVGGLILTLIFYGPRRIWIDLTFPYWAATEVTWACAVAVGMLPCCALLVAPLTFHQLGKASRWRPLVAAAVGGAGGVVGVFLWLAVLSLFTQPINWTRQDDRAVAAMITVTAGLIGTTAGGVAAWRAREDPAAGTMPAAPEAVATRQSYDY